jgi:hypothetical protein
VVDAHEALGQDVQQEAPDELDRVEAQCSECVRLPPASGSGNDLIGIPAGSAGEPPATRGRVSASPTSRHCGTKVALVSLARTSARAPTP